MEQCYNTCECEEHEAGAQLLEPHQPVSDNQIHTVCVNLKLTLQTC